jgi:hypothetical protein
VQGEEFGAREVHQLRRQLDPELASNAREEVRGAGRRDDPRCGHRLNQMLQRVFN